MRTRTEMEIEVASGGSRGSVIRVGSESEVLAFATENIQPNVGFLVACRGDGVDFGNLIIEVDGQGGCNLRALEHRGFFVKGVSVEQALGALQYWLPSQGRIPGLKWEDE